MRIRIPFISLIAAGALTLGGCAYGDFGYGGLGVGVGYGDPYYGAGYGPYGGYGAYPGYYGGLGYGWYDNYYYPGTGVYVYDSYRRPHMWSDRQRSYWSNHRTTSATRTTDWSGFRTRSTSTRLNPTTTTDLNRPRQRT
jgi:hypothetical protein